MPLKSDFQWDASPFPAMDATADDDTWGADTEFPDADFPEFPTATTAAAAADVDVGFTPISTDAPPAYTLPTLSPYTLPTSSPSPNNKSKKSKDKEAKSPKSKSKSKEGKGEKSLKTPSAAPSTELVWDACGCIRNQQLLLYRCAYLHHAALCFASLPHAPCPVRASH
jgi:hypothetical protein